MRLWLNLVSRKGFPVKLNSFPEIGSGWVGVALLPQTDLILSSGRQIRFQPHVLGIPYERRNAALESIQVLDSQTVGVSTGFTRTFSAYHNFYKSSEEGNGALVALNSSLSHHSFLG